MSRHRGRNMQRSVGWVTAIAGAALLGTVALAMPGRAGAQEALAPSGGLRPLTLSEAVRTALARSPGIEVARHSLAQAEGRVTEAWSSVYPRVDFSADYTRNVSPAVNFLPAIIFDPTAGPDEQIAVRFAADNLWQSFFTLEQPLFDGRAFVGVGAAARYQRLQEEVLRGAVQDVVVRVRRSFYDALLAQEQLRLTRNAVDRVREALAEVRAVHRAGVASQYDVLRLEVELANLEPNLLRSENAVDRARRELAVELDLDPGSFEVAGSLATLLPEEPAANAPENQDLLAWAGAAPEGEEREAFVARSLRDRSDLRQLEATEDLRRAELRAEQAEYLPKVSLFGNYGISASQNGSPEFFGEPRAYSRRVGLRVTVPLFQGFARTARVEQTRATLRADQSRTRLARSHAESEVVSALDQVEEARRRTAGQRRTVELAQRGFEIARAQYREGLGSRLELTDAEGALRESEFNYAQAVYDYLAARARLDEVTGTVPTTPR